MVLSAPITVCLAVLGKQIVELEFLAILLGDEPALEPELALYQRLLAGDEDEARTLLRNCLRHEQADRVLDAVVLPALVRAGRDLVSRQITRADYDAFVRALNETAVVEELRPAPKLADPTRGVRGGQVLGVAARGHADALVLSLIARIVPPDVAFQSLGAEALVAEAVAVVEREHPELICIVGLPPGGMGHLRHLCRRLRRVMPSQRILVVRPESRAFDEGLQRLIDDEGVQGVRTLAEAETRIEQLLLLEPEEPRAVVSPLAALDPVGR